MYYSPFYLGYYWTFLDSWSVLYRWLLDSAHDAMAYYTYCRKDQIQPFIDLNEKRGIKVKYKNNFTIGKDGVPVCKAGWEMNHDGSKPSKVHIKFRYPLASRKIRLFPVSSLVRIPNMKEPFILPWKTIRGSLISCLATVKNGKRNIIPRYRRDVSINVRK